MGKVYRRYEKDQIAAKLLETALDLYFEGKDGFSIINLTAAAEEVLAGFIKVKNNQHVTSPVTTARERSISALREIYQLHAVIKTEKQIGVFLNKVKNEIKHHDPSSAANDISLCLAVEVKAAIFRAIENYVLHFGNPTDKMIRYVNHSSEYHGSE